jgi:hypothetical protein
MMEGMDYDDYYVNNYYTDDQMYLTSFTAST